MDQASHPTITSRRHFLNNIFRGVLGVTAAALTYPFLRFINFSVKPKPRYIVVRKNIPIGSSYMEHDFILFVLEDGPMAISRRCTHLGCRVFFRQELQVIECPCHQSRFTLQGERVAGPAKENLATFPVRELLDDKNQVNGYEVTI